jgi:hypothetical protein
VAYDPEAMNNVKNILDDKIEYASSSLEAKRCRCTVNCNRMVCF